MTDSSPTVLKLKQNDILFKAGEKATDLYILDKGRLLVYVINGTQVTPLAYLESSEFLGELAFFDQEERSANLIALEESTLIKIPAEALDHQFPPWLIQIAKSITGKIRNIDDIIKEKGLRKKNVDSIAPLSIDDQRTIYEKTIS